MLSSYEVERKLCTGISVTFAIWVHLTLLLLYLECFLIVQSSFTVSSGGFEGLCPSPSAAHFSFGAHIIQLGFLSFYHKGRGNANVICYSLSGFLCQVLFNIFWITCKRHVRHHPHQSCFRDFSACKWFFPGFALAVNNDA